MQYCGRFQYSATHNCMLEGGRGGGGREVTIEKMRFLKKKKTLGVSRYKRISSNNENRLRRVHQSYDSLFTFLQYFCRSLYRPQKSTEETDNWNIRVLEGWKNNAFSFSFMKKYIFLRLLPFETNCAFNDFSCRQLYRSHRLT